MAVSDNKLEDPALYIRLGPVGRWIISHGWNLGIFPHGKIVSRVFPVLEREFVYQNFKQTKEGIGFKSFKSIGYRNKLLFENFVLKSIGKTVGGGHFTFYFFPWDFLVGGVSSGISGVSDIFRRPPRQPSLGGTKKKQCQVPQGVSFMGVFSYPKNSAIVFFVFESLKLHQKIQNLENKQFSQLAADQCLAHQNGFASSSHEDWSFQLFRHVNFLRALQSTNLDLFCGSFFS